MWQLKSFVEKKIKATRQQSFNAKNNKLRQQAEEETLILVTRFIAFHEGCLLIMQYLKNKPSRDYGLFNKHPTDTSRPIPAIQWDSMVTSAYRLSNIREIHLLNFRESEMQQDPDDKMVTVLLIFAEVNHDLIPIVQNEVIMPFDARHRKGYRAYRQVIKVQFLLGFDEES